MKISDLFKPINKLFYFAGEVPEGAAESADTPENLSDADADSVGQAVETRGEQSIDRASELSEGAAEKARQYCKDIEAKVKSQISRMADAEMAKVKGDPRQDRPDPSAPKDEQEAWEKRVEEWNKRKAEYDDHMSKLTVTLARAVSVDPKSRMVMDSTLKQEGVAEGASAKNMSTRLFPSVIAKKFYVNYKIYAESRGGWAVSENLSDVPGYVEDGSLNLATFQQRTNRVNSAFSQIASQAEALQKQYC